MTAVLPLLYELRAYDQASPAWSPLFFFDSGTGIATAEVQSGSFTPAPEKAWFITGASLQSSPAAGVTALNKEIRIANAAGGRLTVPLTQRLDPGTAGATHVISQKMDLVLIGGVHFIGAVWQYSAGNAANTQTWSYWGYEVPRANVVLR